MSETKKDQMMTAVEESMATDIDAIEEIEEEEQQLPEIVVDGELYTLRISMNKIKQLEKASGYGIMQMVQQTSGSFPIWFVEMVYQYCLYDTNSKSVPPNKALRIFDGFIRECGYPVATAHVIKALDRDLPFLFQAS
jgi:hypothetical protein